MENLNCHFSSGIGGAAGWRAVRLESSLKFGRNLAYLRNFFVVPGMEAWQLGLLLSSAVPSWSGLLTSLVSGSLISCSICD